MSDTSMTTFQDQIRANRWKTVLLFAGFYLFTEAVIFAVIYFGIGQVTVLNFAITSVIALIVMLITYFTTPKVALMASRAEEVTAETEPQLWNIVEELSIASGMPMPRVYVMRKEGRLNAFATGRNMEHGHVVVTQGLLSTMNREEFSGVIAHELSHLRNGDIRLMTMAAALAMIIGIVSNMALRISFFGRGRNNSNGPSAIVSLVALILVAILAPLSAVIIQSAISRKRESLADASAVDLTRNPVGLENALTKINQGGSVVSTAKEQRAHMFFSDPITNLRQGEQKTGFLERLFSTHPPIQERIDLLRVYRGEVSGSEDQ